MNVILDRCGLGSRPAERTPWVGWGDDDPTPAAAHLLDELRCLPPSSSVPDPEPYEQDGAPGPGGCGEEASGLALALHRIRSG